jgi:hypothetical protein
MSVHVYFIYLMAKLRKVESKTKKFVSFFADGVSSPILLAELRKVESKTEMASLFRLNTFFALFG